MNGLEWVIVILFAVFAVIFILMCAYGSDDDGRGGCA
jgi:hypothetical protein